MALADRTDSEVLRDVGARLRADRLRMILTQADLAARSGLSRTTVRDIEAGHDAQFSTLVKLLRALGRLADIETLVPASLVSPVQMVKRQGRPRQRARRPAHG